MLGEMTHFFGIIFVPRARKTARPALGAQVFRKQRPKSCAFFAFFAPLTPQMSEKERFWNALEAKVGASCGQNVDELWIAGQHSPVTSLFASPECSASHSAYHEGFGGLGHALGF